MAENESATSAICELKCDRIGTRLADTHPNPGASLMRHPCTRCTTETLGPRPRACRPAPCMADVTTFKGNAAAGALALATAKNAPIQTRAQHDLFLTAAKRSFGKQRLQCRLALRNLLETATDSADNTTPKPAAIALYVLSRSNSWKERNNTCEKHNILKNIMVPQSFFLFLSTCLCGLLRAWQQSVTIQEYGMAPGTLAAFQLYSATCSRDCTPSVTDLVNFSTFLGLLHEVVLVLNSLALEPNRLVLCAGRGESVHDMDTVRHPLSLNVRVRQ